MDAAINGKLVKRLAPAIREMRRKSDEPITVLIDSPGGSLFYLEKLFELLQAPDKSGRIGRIVAVATDEAASAAANLLAWGDYSIALDRSNILCHDVSLSNVKDLTPEAARQHAKILQDTNDYYARVLAERSIERLVRIYQELKPHFGECSRKFRARHRSVRKMVNHYLQAEDEYGVFDLAGFTTALWAHLSSDNDDLVESVIARLGYWMHVMPVVQSIPTYKSKRSGTPGVLDGPQHLHRLLSGNAEVFECAAGDLKLLVGLLVSELAYSKEYDGNFPLVLEGATREFLFMRSMNDRSHVNRAYQLMVEHNDTFMGARFRKHFGRMSEDERAVAVGQQVLPYVRLFWLFCVQLCRELFEGEHELTSTDAMLLGLVDDVWEQT